jgi:hypothetical protein
MLIIHNANLQVAVEHVQTRNTLEALGAADTLAEVLQAELRNQTLNQAPHAGAAFYTTYDDVTASLKGFLQTLEVSRSDFLQSVAQETLSADVEQKMLPTEYAQEMARTHLATLTEALKAQTGNKTVYGTTDGPVFLTLCKE